MKYQYFLATRWRNRDIALPLIEKLNLKGKTIYSCFESRHNTERIKEDPEEAMKVFESKDCWQEDQEINDIFYTDMDGLKNSDTLIMLLPAGKSSHIEAGVAYGMGKHCILIEEQEETESVYLIFNKTYKSIDDFINHLP